jgi:O-antigen/teichoic acid export membrane protein
VLDLLLIPPFGAVGAAWASAVAYVTTTVMLIAYFRMLSRRQVRMVAAREVGMSTGPEGDVGMSTGSARTPLAVE